MYSKQDSDEAMDDDDDRTFTDPGDSEQESEP